MRRRLVVYVLTVRGSHEARDVEGVEQVILVLSNQVKVSVGMEGGRDFNASWILSRLPLFDDKQQQWKWSMVMIVNIL